MAASGAHPNRRPLLALILLSPVIAEMLSGSTPPIEWLNPIGVLFLIWLYGPQPSYSSSVASQPR